MEEENCLKLLSIINNLPRTLILALVEYEVPKVLATIHWYFPASSWLTLTRCKEDNASVTPFSEAIGIVSMSASRSSVFSCFQVNCRGVSAVLVARQVSVTFSPFMLIWLLGSSMIRGFGNSSELQL